MVRTLVRSTSSEGTLCEASLRSSCGEGYRVRVRVGVRVRLRLVWLGLGRGRAKVLLQDGQIRQTASAVDAEVGEEGVEGRVWSGAGSHAVGLGEGVLREGGEAQHERGELKHVGNECGLRCDVAQMCGRTEVCDACVGACVYSAGRHHG